MKITLTILTLISILSCNKNVDICSQPPPFIQYDCTCGIIVEILPDIVTFKNYCDPSYTKEIIGFDLEVESMCGDKNLQVDDVVYNIFTSEDVN